MLLGQWRNFDHLEEALSMDELIAILAAGREQEERHNRFTAALKGIKLNEGSYEDRFEQVKVRAEARRRELSEDQVVFEKIGIKLEEESSTN
jgi:hypothetical protein